MIDPTIANSNVIDIKIYIVDLDKLQIVKNLRVVRKIIRTTKNPLISLLLTNYPPNQPLNPPGTIISTDKLTTF